MKHLSLLYAVILRLYPRGFRNEFASEMQSVFAEALQDAATQGRSAAARLFLREIVDLPQNLIRQLWVRFCVWATLPWQSAVEDESNTQYSSSYLSSAIAGLPHILYALAIYLPLLVIRLLALQHFHGPSLPVFWMMVAGMLFVARRQRWPRWSSSWIGYGLVFLLEQVSSLFASGLLAYLAAIAWLSVAGLLIFWLARRDWISGLLAVLPITPMWFWLARGDSIPSSLDAAALYLSASLMLSLAVMAIARLGRWQTALLLILAVILATGMPESYGISLPENLSLQDLPDPEAWSSTGGWISSYTLLLIFTAPLWLMALLRHIESRQSRPGD